MIELRVTDNWEDIRQWTGLPCDNHDEALRDAGFKLNNKDVAMVMCIESNVRLIAQRPNGRREPVNEAWWLVDQMESYCYGYNEVEYNGKWYYTVYCYTE